MTGSCPAPVAEILTVKARKVQAIAFYHKAHNTFGESRLEKATPVPPPLEMETAFIR
jgi:hypothetical protein